MTELLTYERLDAIADSYLPALVALAILSSIPTTGPARLLNFALRISTLTALAALVYGFMFADAQLQLWPRFGLDYSTHAALSLVLVIWLSSRWPTGRVVWWALWALYLALMLYQRYHTLADILSTVLVIGPLAWTLVHKSASLNGTQLSASEPKESE